MDPYVTEAKRQLSDTTSYLPLDHDPTMAHQTTVSHTVHDLIASSGLPSTASSLIVSQPCTARFYLLPKIHKHNHPGQPNISTCPCPIKLISSYLDSILSPLLQALPTYIWNTNQALHLFENFQFLGPQCFIFTMNEVAMGPSYACLFVGYFEQSISMIQKANLRSNTRLIPSLMVMVESGI
eukprot:g46805.t1